MVFKKRKRASDWTKRSTLAFFKFK
ncbi:hypothetical protein A5868_001546, partial [Enterococcus sp. 12F9_DIV0723]